MTEQKPATRNALKTIRRMPSLFSSLVLQREFSLEEYDKLKLGFVPKSMDDKWLIFLEGDQLYFHRSWTGVCVYQLELGKTNNGFVVGETLVNRKGADYKNTNDAYDLALLNFLIDNLLLGKMTPFPLWADTVDKYAPGVEQHSFAGTGYREICFTDFESNDSLIFKFFNESFQSGVEKVVAL